MSKANSRMTEEENVDKTKGLAMEDNIPTLESSKDEKQEYQSQGSPPPAMAMPPKPRDPQVPPPASRPPSTSSLQSTASIGAPARTTTVTGTLFQHRFEVATEPLPQNANFATQDANFATTPPSSMHAG